MNPGTNPSMNPSTNPLETYINTKSQEITPITEAVFVCFNGRVDSDMEKLLENYIVTDYCSGVISFNGDESEDEGDEGDDILITEYKILSSNLEFRVVYIPLPRTYQYAQKILICYDGDIDVKDTYYDLKNHNIYHDIARV